MTRLNIDASSPARCAQVDVDELWDYLKFLGHKCKKADVEDMIWEVDEDCDKAVSWDEFKAMCPIPALERPASPDHQPHPHPLPLPVRLTRLRLSRRPSPSRPACPLPPPPRVPPTLRPPYPVPCSLFPVPLIPRSCPSSLLTHAAQVLSCET